jgi:aminoglycoside phosphotransferase (APT) family kinase protein
VDTDTAAGDEVPGLDLPALAAHLDALVPGGLAGPLQAEVIAGGRSNLTYAVSDGAATWIVRRPPLGHVLATAHDMSREHRVISALAGTGVPVPAALGLCEDTTVIGAPFFVMERVAGTVYRTAEQLAPLGADRVRPLTSAMMATLAELHRVDPEQVGLADFGRPEGYLARQVRRWRKQIDSSHTRDLAGLDELRSRLEAATPPESAVGIVHGDFRLDNLLVDAEDRIAAVLDWEMATLGDPLADVGLLAAYQRMAENGIGLGIACSTTVPGYLSGTEMIDAYARAGGRDVSGMGFYQALAFFKIAGIFEGIHYRHINGQTVGAGFDGIGEAVEPVIALGLAALKEE